MNQTSDNPPSNALPSGVDEAVLREAVVRSGYPLQTVVADMLSPSFEIVEEWGFTDDNGSHRSADIFGYRDLDPKDEAPISSSAVIIVECKRSELPYVFFRRVAAGPIPNYPRIIGVANADVYLNERRSKRRKPVSLTTYLKLTDSAFFSADVPTCASFSRAQRRGSALELSGSDPYNHMVLPLVAATRHMTTLFKPKGTPERVFPRILFTVAVVDAPIVAVDLPSAAHELSLRPWVRLARLERSINRDGYADVQNFGIEVVHASYVNTFLDKYLLPLADMFASRIGPGLERRKNRVEVDDLDNWSWTELVGE